MKCDTWKWTGAIEREAELKLAPSKSKFNRKLCIIEAEFQGIVFSAEI
jgi:hypothetical protein